MHRSGTSGNLSGNGRNRSVNYKKFSKNLLTIYPSNGHKNNRRSKNNRKSKNNRRSNNTTQHRHHLSARPATKSNRKKHNNLMKRQSRLILNSNGENLPGMARTGN